MSNRLGSALVQCASELYGSLSIVRYSEKFVSYHNTVLITESNSKTEKETFHVNKKGRYGFKIYFPYIWSVTVAHYDQRSVEEYCTTFFCINSVIPFYLVRLNSSPTKDPSQKAAYIIREGQKCRLPLLRPLNVSNVTHFVEILSPYTLKKNIY